MDRCRCSKCDHVLVEKLEAALAIWENEFGGLKVLSLENWKWINSTALEVVRTAIEKISGEEA